jgi:hypothetical protein
VSPANRSAQLVCLIIALCSTYVQAAEYDFDVSQFEKKAFEWGGYAELKAEHLSLNTDASAYQLNFLGLPEHKSFEQYSGTVELEARYHKDPFSFHLRTHSTAQDNIFGYDDEHKVHDAYLSASPGIGTKYFIGKRALRWGKGYAWSPVAFVERPKDPNDPDLSREGFVLAAVEAIKTGTDSLRTISFTPMLIPVSSDVNEDFGETGHTNLAAKLYLFYKDTDIDVMFLSNGSKSSRIGIDFSRNLKSNIEVHGEIAYFHDLPRVLLTSANTLVETKQSSASYLLGLRYLTENDTTWFVEYYHNGAGYTEQQMELFHQLVDTASSTTPALAPLAKQAASAGYLRPNPMKNYLYIRASNKEPFDTLYLTPSITAIINLDDHSWSLTPEIIYTKFKNIELRTRLTLLDDKVNSEYGEKQNDYKFEFRFRYSF